MTNCCLCEIFDTVLAILTSGDFVKTIGCLVLLKLILTAVLSVAKIFYVFLLSPGKNLKKYGDWAVVTGATDGIGLEYARQLAKKGLKVFLISRTQSKLDIVAAEIGAEKTKTLAIDFSSSESDIYSEIEKATENLNVGVLVNNVGFSYDHPDFYSTLTDAEIDKLININCYSMSKMSRIFFKRFEEQKKGLIISVSSFSALKPMGLLSLYGACKSFVWFLSESLRQEAKYTEMQIIRPYFVVSKLSKIRKATLLIPTPKAYVAQALRTVGHYHVTFGCLAHELFGSVVSVIASTPILSSYYDKINRKMLMSTRARYYKKMANLSKSK